MDLYREYDKIFSIFLQKSGEKNVYQILEKIQKITSKIYLYRKISALNFDSVESKGMSKHHSELTYLFREKKMKNFL
jgi:hypothetical protein